MAGKFVTFMVIPHNEDHVREFNLSRPFIWACGAVLLLAALTFAYFTYGYYATLGDQVASLTLQNENAEMETHLERLRGQLRELRSTVDGLSETDRRMRAYTSLSEPGPEVRKMGVGGYGEMTAPWEERVSFDTAQRLTETYTNIDQLVREARFLKTSFDSILARLAKDESLRDHTPSIFPVAGEGWYSSLFGYRNDPFTGERTFHNGVDIAGRRGTAIITTADGIVENTGFHKRLGHYVTVRHKGGLRTLYAHMLNHTTVSKGQKVKRGDEVGQMGDTGRTTATHVHYSVFLDGRAVDPNTYVFDGSNRSTLF